MTRLGLVLASADDLALVAGLARAAVARRLAVRVFAMHAGVAALAAAPAVVAALLDDGCDLCACATSADRAGVALASLGVVAGSQDDHAALCAWADRVVAFA
ncbi:MAG: DsrE family protein [Myxococcales bacterium]|nr:DsrE family protein [Myxococcales bacterium]